MARQFALFPTPRAAAPPEPAPIEPFDDWTPLVFGDPPDPCSEISLWFNAPERRWNREEFG